MKYNRIITCLLVGLAIAMTSCTSNGDKGEVITFASTSTGDVQGFSKDSLLGHFYAIPYAEAPVGDLRWKAPVPKGKWEGVLDCTKYGPVAPQKVSAAYDGSIPEVSEDCLYLNITTPAVSTKDKLPTMVWIHGGGFKTGSANDDSAEGFAKEGIVVASISYRTGALGFLALKELSEESSYGGSGNYGIQDMICALKWIKKNIKSFGGDPDNITIMGQSAGAMSVAILCQSSEAKGLFNRAVSQSGGFFGPVGFGRHDYSTISSLEGAEAYGKAFMERMGAKTLEELRAMPYEKFLEDDFEPDQLLGFWPIVDGKYVEADPALSFIGGKFNDVNVLIGTNSDEGGMFVSGTTLDGYKAKVDSTFGPLSEKILEAYPATTDEDTFFALSDICRETMFAYPTYKWATLQTQYGKSNVYLYYFDQIMNIPYMQMSTRGASHVTEALYTTGILKNLIGINDALTDVIPAYWTNFIKTGNPNGEGLEYWPVFSEAGETVMHFKEGCSLMGIPNKPQIEVIDQYYLYKQENKN